MKEQTGSAAVGRACIRQWSWTGSLFSLLDTLTDPSSAKWTRINLTRPTGLETTFLGPKILSGPCWKRSYGHAISHAEFAVWQGRPRRFFYRALAAPRVTYSYTRAARVLQRSVRPCAAVLDHDLPGPLWLLPLLASAAALCCKYDKQKLHQTFGEPRRQNESAPSKQSLARHNLGHKANTSWLNVLGCVEPKTLQIRGGSPITSFQLSEQA